VVGVIEKRKEDGRDEVRHCYIRFGGCGDHASEAGVRFRGKTVSKVAFQRRR